MIKFKKTFLCFSVVVLIVLTAVLQCFAATYLTSDGFYYLPDDKYNATVYGCNDNKTELVFPDRLDNYNVRSIADYSFINNGNITSIDFTNAKYLRSVGYLSFSGCSNVKSIVLPYWINSFDFGSFQNCTALTQIGLYARVNKITEQCFYGCSSLTGIDLPDSVKSIERFAFGNCKSLSEVFIPTSVTSIASNAFRNSPNVTIKGNYGSYAEEYAKANNIPFEGISAYDVGDVNMDGGIDILDATLIQKYVVGIVELSTEQKHLADYNNDGDITVVDATEIQKFIVHLN